MPYTLEVCVDSTASALAAKRGGADRLELCSDLVIGGTTPSLALLRQVKAETGLPVRALLRPRFGDFCYDRYELAQMAEPAAALVQAGADGIVTGVLTPEGELDVDALRPIYAAARAAAKAAGRPVVCTLHRAFDVCKDPFAALKAAKALNLGTILTSGQAALFFVGVFFVQNVIECPTGIVDLAQVIFFVDCTLLLYFGVVYFMSLCVKYQKKKWTILSFFGFFVFVFFFFFFFFFFF